MIINIQKTFYKVSDFVTWLKNDQLRLAPEFQRRAVWKSGAKSFLIDTIVKGLPIPIIFLRDKRTSIDSYEPIREIIDGQQRIRTVLSFVCPEYLKDFNSDRDAFTVTKAHNKEIAGKPFNLLDPETKRQILDYEFDSHVLPSRIDDREIIQIFRRMNSTSYAVNKQELRNSEFFGEFKTSLYTLATEQLQRWRAWRIFTEDNISRMAEVEMTTELVEVILKKGIVGKSPKNLDKLFRDYDEDYPNRDEVEKRFRDVMETISEHFSANSRDFVFFKKTLFYTFFSFIYYLKYNFASCDSVSKPKSISVTQISNIKLINQRLTTRTSPQAVLDATDRRTTNVKERKALFDYFNKIVEDGETY
ncbi:DUF262 domain-containing protein [Aquirufa ecclesiirivi]